MTLRADIPTSNDSDTARRRAWLAQPWLVWATLIAWAIIQWHLRPTGIAGDWMGWRQADTMAIARNFVERPSGLLWPRIDWGGAGPGFVEAELQLVPFLIASLNRQFGWAEWTGQLLSLSIITGSAFTLYQFLRSQYGALPAFTALCTWLASQGTVFVSTSVQPDVLSLLFSILALSQFVRYLKDGQLTPLVFATAALALASLVKPTALQLGVVEFVLVLLTCPRRLKSIALWTSWLFVITSVAILLWHGRQLYLTYGNTFGILSGGDRKMPRLEHLLHPKVILDAIRISLTWGIGWLGAVAGLWLVLRRRVDAMAWALAAGSATLIIVALRYTSNVFYGSHYHLPTTLLGAVLVAQAVGAQSSPRRTRWIQSGAILASALLFVTSLRRHSIAIEEGEGDPSIKIARVLKPLIRPGELVVVRGTQASWEGWWNTQNNFEDPRTLYVAHARGWVLSADDASSASLVRAMEQGALWYVDWGTQPNRTGFDTALRRVGQLRYDEPDVGRIWRLTPGALER